MKPITKYVCEICNTEYDTQEEALKCEKYHKPIKEVRYDYGPYYEDWKDGEPHEIIVVFEDGSQHTYLYS